MTRDEAMHAFATEWCAAQYGEGEHGSVRDAWAGICRLLAKAGGEPALLALLSGEAVVVPVAGYAKHLKRGTTYKVLAAAELQASSRQAEGSVLTIYRADADGGWWARPVQEFMDGRFEIATSPFAKGGDHG